MLNRLLFLGLVIILAACQSNQQRKVGQTSVAKWQGDKRSAISITYDDGIINQLTIARPIMNKLGFPGTFYIITGKLENAAKGKFVGRPPSEIIEESASIRTNKDNFFERASLIAFTGTTEAVEFHSDAGSLFESGKIEQAYTLIDKAYEGLRKGTLKNTEDIVFHNNSIDTTTWQDYKKYAAEGHEIASHTVTHARLAVLDEANLLYELEQSKADIAEHLGKELTFSAECPYGTENERVMKYAHEIYPALRNRMPELYLDELNRASNLDPGKSEKEYVQWQRGPRTAVPMEKMKSWVDTCMAHDNIWLVLVFHGINGVGWEPKTDTELETYFNYMKKNEHALWIATFADVTKYIRERKSTAVSQEMSGDTIKVQLNSDLDPSIYNVPLTLKTYVPKQWKSVNVAGINQKIRSLQDEKGSFILYDVNPNNDLIYLSQG